MKKFISVILCCILLSFCLGLPSLAVTEEKTTLYLNYGKITIGEYEISGYDINGQKITEPNPAGYIITQSNPKTALNKGIIITAANCEIELCNLNIKRTNEYDCALAVQKGSEVTATITGENRLISGSSRAGFEITYDSKVTLKGDGSLYAESSLNAGIGGGNGNSNGTLIIESGTIHAVGGIDGYSAGIGGGSSGKGGNITINGGYICAEGGLYAAGIGGGFMCGGNITINGGVITATGGDGGAGIGSAYLANSATNITINGGSVKAIGGAGAENIGSGAKSKTEFSGIFNSDSNTVTLVKFPISSYNEMYINGIDTFPITELHPDDDSLYLYADDNAKIITAYMKDGTVKFLSFSNKGVSEVFPYGESCERFCDKLIMDKGESASVTDGFTTEENCLFHNSVLIDSFAPAMRGDVNFDGQLDGMDAVICNCAVNGMISEELIYKLADIDKSGAVDENDFSVLVMCGLGGV